MVHAYLCSNTDVDASAGSLVCDSEVDSEVDSVTLTGSSDCMSVAQLWYVVKSTTDCSVSGVCTSTDVAVSVDPVYCSNKRLIR